MLLLDLMATAVSVISGGLAAVRMRLDLVGVVCLAMMAGYHLGWAAGAIVVVAAEDVGTTTKT